MNTCYNPFSLSGKTILVTGASSGIGKATSIECSKMGAKLIITGRNEDRLNQTLDTLVGTGHRAISADLTEETNIERLVQTIEAVDGVVHCAGISIRANALFCSKKKFMKIYPTNVFSPIELTRQLLKAKKYNANLSIVVISSIATKVYSYGNGIYGSGKAALSTWMKYAAKELSLKGVRVNCIYPGMVETPLIRKGAESDEQLAEDMKHYLHGRYGRPEEIAYGAIYLLSDAAQWITGADLTIDGGIVLR